MTAGSAEEAEALLQPHRFDLVILDITLPGESGLTLVQGMRGQGNAFEVVLIAAFADLDTAIEGRAGGAAAVERARGSTLRAGELRQRVASLDRSRTLRPAGARPIRRVHTRGEA